MNAQHDNDALRQADAQMESVREMVAALEVDYDRLEELREEKAESAWSANWSLVGCMPDNDPLTFESADDAREALIDELVERAEAAETTVEDLGESLDANDIETVRDAGARAEKYNEAAQHLRGSGDYSICVNGWHFWITDDVEFEDADELAELEAAAGDCEDREGAERRIQEDALSVEIRSDWRPVGDDSDDSEFRIVLCTGGPHVQIMGELAQGVPVRAWLEYQDWGTPMTERANDEGDHDALLAYASQFFFGE